MAPWRETAHQAVGGRPLWLETATRSAAWAQTMGASQYLCLRINYGILDLPTVPFESGELLPLFPQTEEDKEFGLADLCNGMAQGIFKEVSEEHMHS